ncbi:pyruvate dehydrogenase (acetyl-transferring) E1 component subunit alpha [Parafrankia elaeagni]|uniref:pyruvate dehydrogenase (acetyl-transferring) E1 component subunit alpha n=1 Tax=Parafrankia elaeagni TaxID=222534 RepID=UPI0003789923|nr:pyruvate dehydrogenase (acetyl-transferring) E1 component subunit alpha [Parafrankia elaeagni]
MVGVIEAPAGDVELVGLIAPDGAPIGDDPDVAPDQLTWLYETMVATRELDAEFVNLQRQGQLALFPSCRGQEAAQVGAAAALQDTDWLFPQYRELGVFLVRGIDPGGLGHMWRGTLHGGAGFTERNCAPLSIPIGTHALHAVGAAMASTLNNDGGVAVAFIGDGATSEGDVHEALNFAAVYEAPCIFYVQNNHWAISVPLADQLRAPSIAHKAVGYGMPGVRVDGNDVLACLAVTAEAAARARAGGGPTLIEAVTYRIGAHTTSDDPTRYRPAEELADWETRDPITRLGRYLAYRNLWSAELQQGALARAAELRTRLRNVVFDAPDPSPLEAFDHVFAAPTPALSAQRAELAAELAQRG